MSKGSRVQTEYVFALALLHYGALYWFFPKEICWFSRKSVILRRQLNKHKAYNAAKKNEQLEHRIGSRHKML